MDLGNTTSNRYERLKYKLLSKLLGNLSSLIFVLVYKVEGAHWNLKRILQTSMDDLCFCWDSINKMIVLQHNAIKASFEKSLHAVGHAFNIISYKKLLCFVPKYALQHITDEMDRIECVGLDKARCGCTLRSTHGLPCACELASFGVGCIPLQSLHVMWTRLNFLDISSDESSTEKCQSKKSLM